MLGRLPVDEQLDAFRDALARNTTLLEVLRRCATLDLPHWYLAGGCLFQTIWNVVTDRPPTEGIKDYDLFYFDDTDTSWQAEDSVLQASQPLFADLPAVVEIRNQARVHLWYEAKFGAPCPPHRSTEAAIDTFIATTCCLGVRLEPPHRHWRIYAPHGFSDVFDLIVRPNPVLAPRGIRSQNRTLARTMANPHGIALAVTSQDATSIRLSNINVSNIEGRDIRHRIGFAGPQPRAHRLFTAGNQNQGFSAADDVRWFLTGTRNWRAKSSATPGAPISASSVGLLRFGAGRPVPPGPTSASRGRHVATPAVHAVTHATPTPVRNPPPVSFKGHANQTGATP